MARILGANPLIEVKKVVIKNNSMTALVNLIGISLKPKTSVTALVFPPAWNALRNYQAVNKKKSNVTITILNTYKVRQSEIATKRPVEILGGGIKESHILGKNAVLVEVETIKVEEKKEVVVPTIIDIPKIKAEEIPTNQTKEEVQEEIKGADKNQDGRLSIKEIKELKVTALKEYAATILGEKAFDMSRKEILKALKGE